MEQPENTSLTSKKDPGLLSPAQRWAGLYTVLLMLLLAAFFVYHQRTNTGFFTLKFKTPEMLALYIPMIIALIPPIQRFIRGRRDSRQLSEAAADLSLAFGSLWLFIIFPFDFAHLADPLPTNMRFAFAWITNNVARIILLLQVIIGFLSALGIMIGGRKLRVPRGAEHTNLG